MIAYWDNGSCGPNGSNANWEWCDKSGGGACKENVKTEKCPSGTASLKKVFGNQHATEHVEQQHDTQLNMQQLFSYHRNGCNYAYYAIYACTGNSL